MISDHDLEQLRYKGESADLDFKQAQYHFVGATDHQKSELLKDILAMANAYRAGDGHILIGFQDKTPHPAEVVGIAMSDHIDDAALQQFIHSKIDPPLEFQYEERLFEGKHVAVITIPKQPRPFAPNRDYGKLKKNTVYVRRGSSTDEASISEMSKMALADAGASKNVNIELRIDDEDNKPLPDRLELTFLEFEDLPDYEEDNWLDFGNGHRTRMPSMRTVNRHYYRESAEYHTTINSMILIRLSLSNHSNFALGEVKLELSCHPPQGDSITMLRSNDLPEEPRSGDYLHNLTNGFHSLAEQLREKVSIDQRSSEPTCHVLLNTLRPGETGRAETDIALLPSGAGDYTIKIRILANEITTPIIKEHKIKIEGETKPMNLEDLSSLLYGPE